MQENEIVESRKSFPTGSLWQVKRATAQGVRVNGWGPDCFAWPGDTGSVVERTIRAPDGYDRVLRYILFERDRRLSVVDADPEILKQLGRVS